MKKTILTITGVLLFAFIGLFTYKYNNRSYHPAIPDVEICVFNCNPGNPSDNHELNVFVQAMNGVTACSVNSRGKICVSFRPDLISVSKIQEKIESIAGKATAVVAKSGGGVCPMDKIGGWFTFN